MYRVLLVDDEQIERMALAKKIDRYYGDKVNIYHAVNGREAVDMCSEHKNDIIIMDISMPEMNGVMAAKYIRQIDDKCSIIFLTAYDDFEYARNAIKIRALDYLLKPCDINDLLAVMDMAIQKLDRECDFKGNTKENKPERKRENVKNFDEQTTIKYLREYVENNYTFDISMQEVAEDMGYSDAYFSKLFKQYFNQNFTAYLTEYRIKKAKELLTDTNNSIKDISRMVGYEDSNYFAKIFKRIVGEIPSKFRENLIENK
jgi:DNA-binding response regulator (fragment)